jgi:hypothetical protein
VPPVKAVAVDVVVAPAATAVVKPALKVVPVAHAMAPLLHVVVVLLRVHALIAKIVAKEDLTAHHRTVSMSAAIDAMTARTTGPMMDPMTAIWTETMTAVPVAMSCHATSTRS